VVLVVVDAMKTPFVEHVMAHRVESTFTDRTTEMM